MKPSYITPFTLDSVIFYFHNILMFWMFYKLINCCKDSELILNPVILHSFDNFFHKPVPMTRFITIEILLFRDCFAGSQ